MDSKYHTKNPSTLIHFPSRSKCVKYLENAWFQVNQAFSDLQLNIHRFFGTSMTLDTAEAYCRTVNNSAVWSIESQQEQRWVLRNVVSGVSGDYYIWIGAHDKNVEGMYDRHVLISSCKYSYFKLCI